MKRAFRRGLVGLGKPSTSHGERPQIVRLRKADLTRRVNGSLALRFELPGLTSFAGLELVRQYFAAIDLPQRIRRHLSGKSLATDFGIASLVLLLLGLIIAGGRRLRHLLYLAGDPVILRFCGLKRLPTPRTVGRWLAHFAQRQVEALLRLNDEVVAEAVRSAGIRRLTIDVDGSVVSTGQQVAWAQRGFNPHHRKVPSYYPVTAYEAQTGVILRVKNRPGNVHDGKAGVPFLRAVFAQVEETLGRSYRCEFRMDGAFFRQDVIELLERRGAEYAIKVPFFAWMGLKQKILQNRLWQSVDSTVDSFECRLYLDPWKRWQRVVVYRKRVQHATAKNFQLDLFDPADGHYEYSAIATNKDLQPPALWFFLCGRGSHEKAYGELKAGFAFDAVPSQRYGANSAWQVLSILAFNLMRGFQVATTASRRSPSRKRRTLYSFETIETLRYQCLHRAGLLVRPEGRSTLDVGTSPQVKRRFAFIHQGLLRAA